MAETGWTPAVNEIAVLAVLADIQAEYSVGFDYISKIVRLDRAAVRTACRSLRRKGLAEFRTGLWTEDGEPAGSGYTASAIARTALARARGQEQEKT